MGGGEKGKEKNKNSGMNRGKGIGGKAGGGKGGGDVQISKLMSYILRHNAENLKLKLRPDGYVGLALLLPHLKGATQVSLQHRTPLGECQNRESY